MGECYNLGWGKETEDIEVFRSRQGRFGSQRGTAIRREVSGRNRPDLFK